MKLLLKLFSLLVFSKAVLLAEIFVANVGNSSITVFEDNATGNMAPIRTIVGSSTIIGSSTTLVYPVGVNVYRNELFVADSVGDAIAGVTSPEGLYVYNPKRVVSGASTNANGNVAPIREISGLLTGIDTPYASVVSGGKLYVFVTPPEPPNLTSFQLLCIFSINRGP